MQFSLPILAVTLVQLSLLSASRAAPSPRAEEEKVNTHHWHTVTHRFTLGALHKDAQGGTETVIPLAYGYSVTPRGIDISRPIIDIYTRDPRHPLHSAAGFGLTNGVLDGTEGDTSGFDSAFTLKGYFPHTRKGMKPVPGSRLEFGRGSHLHGMQLQLFSLVKTYGHPSPRLAVNGDADKWWLCPEQDASKQSMVIWDVENAEGGMRNNIENIEDCKNVEIYAIAPE